MTIEEQLKQFIKDRYGSVRAFALKHNFPYSSVANIFSRGIDTLGLQAAANICDCLNIDIDGLARGIIRLRGDISLRLSSDLYPAPNIATHQQDHISQPQCSVVHSYIAPKITPFTLNAKEIGNRIKIQREQCQMTLEYIASKLQVSKSTILRYERGEFERIKPPVLNGIASVLGVPFEYLTGQTDMINDVAEPHNNIAAFSNRLRELRQSRNMTQQSLADLLGTSKSSINMYERGEREPGIDMLVSISRVFDVGADYLIGSGEWSPFGSNLRTLRKNNNLTMRKLGEMLGLAESTISQYESGKREPSQKTLLQLCEIFNISADCILGICSNHPLPAPTSKNEQILLQRFRSLNPDGAAKLLAYSDDLVRAGYKNTSTDFD